jgi:hypothetical protein
MFKKKIIIPLTAAVASVATSSAFANTSSDAVSTAISDGQTLVGAIAPGVIGIAAIMLGVGIAVSWLRK